MTPVRPPQSLTERWRDRAERFTSLLSMGEPWSELVLLALAVVLVYGVYLNGAS